MPVTRLQSGQPVEHEPTRQLRTVQRVLYVDQAQDEAPESGVIHINPWTLSDDERLALIQQAKAGELLEIRTKMLVYPDEPNANYFRVTPSKLEAYVQQANDEIADNRPPQVLMDHGSDGGVMWPSVMKRVGYWASARLVTGEDGVRRLMVEAAITDPLAQLKFLRRELDRASIGLDRAREEAMRCSVCETESVNGWWPDCDHWPGDTYEGVLAETFHDAPFLEFSFVAEPAAGGTQIVARRARAMPRANNENGPATTALYLNEAIDIAVDDETTREDVVQQLADAADVDAATVEQIASGEVSPTIEQLQSFADALGVEMMTLLEEPSSEEDTEMEPAEAEATADGGAAATASMQKPDGELAKLRAERDKARKQAFEAAFTAQVGVRLLPQEKEDQFQAFASVYKHDIDAWKASVERRPQLSSHPTEPHGDGSSNGTDPDAHSYMRAGKGDPLALAKAMKRFGKIRDASPEALERIGFHRLRFNRN